MSIINILVAIVLILIFLKFVFWFLSYRDRLAKWRQFPGSTSWPVIGHSLEFKTPKDILPQALKYQKQYGLTFRVQLGKVHTLFTADPRLSEIITTSHTLIKKSLGVTFMRNWLGEGLITADNPRWKIHRRLITPTFHFKILEDFVPIFNKNAKHLVNFMKENRMNAEFDVYEDIVLCSLDAICETAMGISINALKDGNQSNYVKSVKFMGKILMRRSFSFWKQYDFLFNMSSERKQELKMIDHIRKITDSVIKTRTEEFRDRNNKKSEDFLGRKNHEAFLDHLLAELEQNGGIMSHQELREEVDTFIFSGHHTVSSAISFAIHFLTKHQDVQQRVYDEIIQVYGSESELTFDKLAELKYLELVIKETLRLCPSVPLHSRVMTEEVHFDGKIIPKGVHVVLFLYGSHRNDKIFKNPEQFDPDRFLDDNLTKNALFAYLPFNAGPRNCIGQRYAMTKMKCILSILLKEFRFTKDANFEIQPIAEGVLKSINGVRVKIEQR